MEEVVPGNNKVTGNLSSSVSPAEKTKSDEIPQVNTVRAQLVKNATKQTLQSRAAAASLKAVSSKAIDNLYQRKTSFVNINLYNQNIY